MEPERQPLLGDIPSEEFREALHHAAEWIADYRSQIEKRRVTPESAPGEVAAQFSCDPPAQPSSLRSIQDDFETLILPHVVHWGHPAFMGYFGSTSNAAGILGEMFSAALNVSAMTWAASPAATELEAVTLQWIARAIGLPSELRGVVFDTASVATFHALAAARERVCPRARQLGLRGPDAGYLRVYASEQAHSSVEKAAIALGIGEENVRRVAVDSDFRMDPAALACAIAQDLAAGRVPMAVVATLGTTSTAAVDPLPEIGRICADRNIWLHVDAAYGGVMGLLPETRRAMDGLENADSVVVNPHKFLFVPLDFSALYLRDPAALKAVFSLTPEYLIGDASRHEENYMDYGIQLGRRFRALKAWMVFRAFGLQGLQARVREHRRLALRFAGWIDEHPDFRLIAPPGMGVVCFRYEPAQFRRGDAERLDRWNSALLESIQGTGRLYLTQTRLRGRTALRLAVGNVLTEERHLEQAWRLIQDESARLLRFVTQIGLPERAASPR